MQPALPCSARCRSQRAGPRRRPSRQEGGLRFACSCSQGYLSASQNGMFAHAAPGAARRRACQLIECECGSVSPDWGDTHPVLGECRSVRAGEANPQDVRAAAFAGLFRDAFDDVLRFCTRRLAPETAEDIAAETMAVAWRRFEEMPASRGDQRAWLFTTARNLMLRDSRNDSRRRTLAVRIAPSQISDVPGVDGEASARVDLGRAWGLLSERHQEALALTVWEGLTTLEAATVLGISPVAYRLRLSRARKVLRAHLGVANSSDSTAPRAPSATRTTAPEATP
ncbi:MAG: RNA polymerase sigma factor [Pedococcus sp.]